MKKWIFVVAAVAVFGALRMVMRQPSAAVKEITLEKAVVDAGIAIESFGDSGYQSWNTGSAADHVSKYINSLYAVELEEDDEFQKYRPYKFFPITCVIGEPTDSWQVTLEPVENDGTLTVKGWGRSLTSPRFVRRYKITQYGGYALENQ